VHKEGLFYAGLDLALSGHSYYCGGVGPSKEEAIRKSAENGLETAKAAVASLEQILTDLNAENSEEYAATGSTGGYKP
jgi:hypothetical protein